MTELVTETSELVGKTLEAESMDKVTDWEEAVTINKAGVMFGFHTPKTGGFVSKLDTIRTSEIDAVETSMDSYTKATGRRKKRLAEPRPSTLMVETRGTVA